jgi:TRAP-type C4-dicarboxylate transport system substrate-binding protein
MRALRTVGTSTAFLLLGMCAAACSGSAGDRAGGDATATVRVLTLAQANDGIPPEVATWMDEVRRRSGGTLRIDVRQGWRSGDPTAEVGIVADVGSGKADLGWVGARALDRVGVTSLQPLVAPLLIDSQDLQAAVFSAGIPDGLVRAVDSPDVVGLGVLPGPMRKVLGVDKPFRSLGDFAGQVVGLQDGDVAAETLRALGATPRPVASGAHLDGLSGYEQQLASVWGNHYELSAGFVTSNLNLWPRPLVLLGSRSVLATLEPQQRAALRAAASASLPATLADARAEDRDAVPRLCGAGMSLPAASNQDIAALRTAVQPVYDRLDGGAGNSKVLARIAAVKRDLGAPPDSATCPRTKDPEAGSSSANLPDGTYRSTLTDTEARRCSGHEQDLGGVLELDLRKGSVHQYEQRGGSPREIGWAGNYRVFRDRFELTETTGATMTAVWSFDGASLRLSQLQNGECEDAVVWTSRPWVLEQPPDNAAARPSGVYRATVTGADWAAKKLTGQVGDYTLTFTADAVTLTEPDGGRGFTGSFRLFRDRIEIVAGQDTLEATWTATGDRLMLGDVTSAACPDCGPYAVVLAAHPWQRTA